MIKQSFTQKTDEALVNLLLKQVNLTSLANVVMLTVTAAVIWILKEDRFVLYWLLLGYLLIIFRFLVLSKIKKQEKTDLSALQLEHLITAMLIFSGLHWGSIAWVYLDANDTSLFPFLSAVLLGLVSATIPSLAARPKVWLAYSLSIFLIVAAKFIYLNNWSMVILVALGQLLMSFVSQNLAKQIKHSITQDLRNAELLEEVSLAKDNAEKANLAKSKFMASASHDLRQPLHVQSILLEVLNLRLEDPELKQLLKKIVQSNTALNSLFNAVLEISQLDAGALKTNISHQNLNKICRNLFAEYKILAHQKGLGFRVVAEQCVVFSDPLLLNRILSNLLSNALKFTQSGNLSVEINSKNDEVYIVVTDTGIGIDPSQHQKIFEEYVQIGNQARDRSKGIGLGLALVSRLCELLNHRIEVASSLAKGTKFKITLPRGDNSKIVSVDTDINHNQIDNIHILLIDDEEDVIDAMSLILSNWGCHTKGVKSIAEAMEYITKKDCCPDLIITDYRLNSTATGLDGLSLIQKKLCKKIPCLLITGDTDPELLEKVRQQDLYILHKPIKVAMLKKALNILLTNKS